MVMWYRVKSRWGGRAGLALNFYFRYRSAVHEIHRHSNPELTNLHSMLGILWKYRLRPMRHLKSISKHSFYLVTFYYSMKYLCMISPRLFSQHSYPGLRKHSAPSSSYSKISVSQVQASFSLSNKFPSLISNISWVQVFVFWSHSTAYHHQNPTRVECLC